MAAHHPLAMIVIILYKGNLTNLNTKFEVVRQKSSPQKSTMERKIVTTTGISASQSETFNHLNS